MPGVAYLKIVYGHIAGVYNNIAHRIVRVSLTCLPIVIYPTAV